MSFRLLLTIIFIGLVIVFVVQNVAIVEIKFLLWSIEMSRALLYFIIFLLGLLSGWLLTAHHAKVKQRKKQGK
jgi:putative membrane protein